MLRFNGHLAVDSKKHEVQSAFSADFPVLLMPDLNNAQGHPLTVPLRLANLDDTELIQFSVSSFSYHQRRYTSFADFKKKGLGFVEKFLTLVGLNSIQQTGLRYINQIPVIRENGLVPLSRYLKFGFRLPSTIPERIESFSTRLVTKLGSGELRMNVNLKQLKDPQSTEAIVLDFDFLTLQDTLPQQELAKKIDESHQHTKNVFLSLVTDDYLNVLRQERN